MRQSRAEIAADFLMEVAGQALPGERIGSREELRSQCQVSVGTFNEALRIAQSRGVITVRPGPGGGLFAAQPPPMVRLGNAVLALDTDQTSVAEAIRIRNALDPLLIEDALWHASPADLAAMRGILQDMRRAADTRDAMAFMHANWRLHAAIAAVSPHPVLRSLYTSLLDLIESHTLSILPDQEQALPDVFARRHALHAALVEAIAAHDRERAMSLIAEHDTADASANEPATP
jgi:DNA-binding FadR family transcriptional regulator